jgi:opacity protein-like surface antigen
MKYLLGLLICVSTTLTAQHNFDPLIKHRVTCDDVQYNAFQLIPKYYNQNKYDSIEFFLEYWENKCGPSEYSFRVKTLLRIQNGTFHDEYVGPREYNMLTYFRDYIEWKLLMDSTQSNPLAFYHANYQDAGLIFRFNSVTAEMAKRIYEKYEMDLSCDELAILALYRENPDEFKSIANSCPNGILYQYVAKEEEAIRKALYGNIALISGLWIPQGNLSTLGAHPSLGFLFGLQKNRWLFDITLLFRFIKSKNTYQVMFEDQLYDTDHFFGGYVGLDVNYQLSTFSSHRVYALSGIAYDGFDALEDKDDDDFTKSIGSLNLNLGLGIKWMINDHLYIGTEWRYNFVDYNNRGGTDLSGNTQSIRLVFGSLSKIGRGMLW